MSRIISDLRILTSIVQRIVRTKLTNRSAYLYEIISQTKFEKLNILKYFWTTDELNWGFGEYVFRNNKVIYLETFYIEFCIK